MNHEDASMLLVTKEAELNGLRQQLQQVTDDFRRTLTVLSGRDSEIERLDGTVNALREMMAEKDALFGQFQQQVQEMEALHMSDAERCAQLEQRLAQQEQGWQQQQEANELDRDAEVQQLRQDLLDTEARWSDQLMAVRQEAMDEYSARSSQLMAQVEGAAEAELSVRRELESCRQEVLLKQQEADEAQRQLTGTLESLQRLEESHKKALQAKEEHIKDLQARVTHLSSNSTSATLDHETHMTQLITGLTQMKESCTKQAAEAVELSADVRRLQEEKRALKDGMSALEAKATKLETERNVLESALQHEVTAQASAQAELNIFKAKLHEAVAELEKRTAAAEGRAGQLMQQLVAERGRLVDAVVEQANSSSPALAAELARSLEADRRHTQSELQRAQERASSLQEDLSLIRTTLLPLTMSYSKTPPLQRPEGSGPVQRAAGRVMQEHSEQEYADHQQFEQQQCQQQHCQQQQQWSNRSSDGQLPYTSQQLDSSHHPSPGGYTIRVHPGDAHAASSPRQAQQPQACLPSSPQHNINSPHVPYTPTAFPHIQQPACRSNSSRPHHSAHTPYNSPAAYHSTHPAAANGYSNLGAAHFSTPIQATATPNNSPAAPRGAFSTAGAAATARSPSSLAGLVTELQADVDKLQQQLHTSRRQLNFGPGGDERSRHLGRDSRPSTAVTANLSSPHTHHHQQQQQQPHPGRAHSTSPPTPNSIGTGSNAPAGADKELAKTLRYLMSRAERLSAENGALRCQLGGRDGSNGRAVSPAGAGTDGRNGRGNSSAQNGTAGAWDSSTDTAAGMHVGMPMAAGQLRSRSASPLRRHADAYEQLQHATDSILLQCEEDDNTAGTRAGLGSAALASASKAARTASKLRHKAAIDSITSRHSLNPDMQALDALLSSYSHGGGGSSSSSRSKLGKALGQLLMSPGADRVQRLKGTSSETLRRLSELSPVRRHLMSLGGHGL